MTIAVCCVSPEGVVFGADSTASFMVPGVGFHYLNHNQKVFEIGSKGTMAIVTWGLASLGDMSHRTMLAQLADKLAKKPAKSVLDACNQWIEHVWPTYQSACASDIAMLKALAVKSEFVVTASPSPSMRTKKEETAYGQLQLGLLLGFCIGGYHPADRLPYAYHMQFDPLVGKPTPTAVAMGLTNCWGAPKVFSRIIIGIDPDVRAAILSSGNWKGGDATLNPLLAQHQLYLQALPLRDAVDFVHSCISSTIKTLKFSSLSQVCGGPIEIAVVSTDREFRWVRHKEWDVAIKEGQVT